MRSILGAVVGTIVAGLTVALLEGGAAVLIFDGKAPDVNQPLPAIAFAAVVGAWIGAAATGSLVATAISRALLPARVVVAFLSAAALWNLLAIPSPWWMWVVGLVGPGLCGNAVASAWLRRIGG
jgi:hypothetical protein